MLEDLKAGYDELIDIGYSADQIIIAGMSMGTGPAIQLATQKECRALITDGAFTRILAQPPWLVSLLGGLAIRYPYNSLKHIARVKCPVLLAHAESDGIIPYANGVKLFRKAQNAGVKVRFFSYPGTHNEFMGDMVQHHNTVKAFVDDPETFSSQGPFPKRVKSISATRYRLAFYVAHLVHFIKNKTWHPILHINE